MDGALTAVAIFALAGAIVWYGSRATQAPDRRTSSHSPQSDPVGLMILFNSMREILQQQKDLVRQVNESLSRKVNAVREAAALATESLDRLRETKARLVAELEELREEVADLRREAEYLHEHGTRSAALRAIEEDPDFETEEALVPPTRPALPPAPEPEDALVKWVAKEPEASAESEAAPEDEPEAVSDLPEYTESSREALRSLLGLDGPVMQEEHEPKPAVRAAHSVNGNGNGKSVPATVHARVHEYHRAGMSVTQIAQELGLGKGEIRLILGLRKGRHR